MKQLLLSLTCLGYLTFATPTRGQVTDCERPLEWILPEGFELTLHDSLPLYLDFSLIDSTKKYIRQPCRLFMLQPGRIVEFTGLTMDERAYFVQLSQDLRGSESENYYKDLAKVEKTNRNTGNELLEMALKAFQRREIPESAVKSIRDSLSFDDEKRLFELNRKYFLDLNGWVRVSDLIGQFNAGDSAALQSAVIAERKRCEQEQARVTEQIARQSEQAVRLREMYVNDSLRQIELDKAIALDDAAERKSLEKVAADKRRLLIEKYGDATGNRLLRREVWIGMSSTMVQDSWGSPDDKVTQITDESTVEQWTYWRNSHREQTIALLQDIMALPPTNWVGDACFFYFKNDILTVWQKVE
ncbi:MAG: hypothetical protein WBP42_00630 [Candidatus Zixiibacteriota bacterium]